MTDNRISAELPAEQQQTAMEAITMVRESLPFLIDVKSDTLRGLPKIGVRNQAFTHKALAVATQTPDILPRSFDIDEMRRDLALYDRLQPILLALMHLQELVETTATVAGSEAYMAALEVYRYAKANGSVAGLDILVDELGQRFNGQGARGRAASEETEESPEAIA